MTKDNEQKKVKTFKIIFNYLKNDKFKVFLYIFLVVTSYLPGLLTTFFYGYALEAIIVGNFNEFSKYVLYYIGIYIFFYSILSTPRELLYNSLQQRFSRNIQKDLYKKISDLPAIAFEDIGVGEFVNRLTNDSGTVLELLAKLIRMICRSLVIIVVFVIAYSVHYVLGIQTTIFAIFMGVASYIFLPKIKSVQENIRKDGDKIVKTATENILGIREIKGLGIKRTIEETLFKNLDSLVTNQEKASRFETFYYNISNFIYYVFMLIYYLTAGYLLYKGKTTFAVFTVLIQYFGQIDYVVSSISDYGVYYSKVKVSLKRIDEILNNRLYPDEFFGNVVLDNPKGVIKFDNVSFRYTEKEKNTLRKLSLTIEPNRKVAIVGRSGNGKSTIFNLLLRYFNQNVGSITLDDIPIQDLTEKSLRSNISVIRQAPFLFNLSILDNLKVVKKDATLKEIREVCKKAYIDDYIMSLPDKYESIIGEGGVNLSGGQKQRLAIARTLLINTKVILFDEATSALDNESQEYVKKTIDELAKDHTIIIVAHRLSTIIDADIIHIIDKGTLAGSGTHEELLKNNEIYKDLYEIDIE